MKLGAFSVSLPVADLGRSQEFYERLGFEAIGGDAAMGYVMLRNAGTVLGLFCFDDMDFDQPMLTFNPGLDADLQLTDSFDDVRVIRQRLVDGGTAMDTDLDPAGRGPAHVAVRDPDGHRILIDQFCDAPTH